MILYTQL